MSTTWDHILRPLVGYQKGRVVYHTPTSYVPDPVVELYPCRGCPKKSPRMATWLGTYSCVTGRGGRVTTARRRMCDEHATKWREKYEVTVLEAAPTNPRDLAWFHGDLGVGGDYD